MTGPESTVLVDDLVFPECPRWHDGALWFSDMHDNQVRAVDATGTELAAIEVARPGGLGFLPDGDLLVVCMDARTILRYDGRRTEVYCDLSEWPGDFLNDMAVDGEGRAYVGVRLHAAPGARHNPSALLRIDPDGSVSVAADDLVGPNGMGFVADGAVLVIAETHAGRLTAFDRDSAGNLHGRRAYADLAPLADPGRQVFPDGIAVDAEGAVWVGTAVGRRYLRVLAGGELAGEFRPPDGRWGVACELGGDDGRTLFMTTCTTSTAGLRALAGAARPADPAAARLWAREHSRGYLETIAVAVPAAVSG